MVLLLPVVFADIEIKLTEYDAALQKAKIRLYNADSIDYTNIVLVIGETQRSFPGSLLKPGTAILIPANIAPGQRTVFVHADGGHQFSAAINFAKDFDQVFQERQQQNKLDEQANLILSKMN